MTQDEIDKWFEWAFIGDNSMEEREYLDKHHDEIKALAKLGAALKEVMPKAAMQDEHHIAHLTYRCFGEGEGCGNWQWYVWKSQDKNTPVAINQAQNTPEEALQQALHQENKDDFHSKICK